MSYVDKMVIHNKCLQMLYQDAVNSILKTGSTSFTIGSLNLRPESV